MDGRMIGCLAGWQEGRLGDRRMEKKLVGLMGLGCQNGWMNFWLDR